MSALPRLSVLLSIQTQVPKKETAMTKAPWPWSCGRPPVEQHLAAARRRRAVVTVVGGDRAVRFVGGASSGLERLIHWWEIERYPDMFSMYCLYCVRLLNVLCYPSLISHLG